MVHPLKASTSFDCDGCGHHASFHRIESKEDEEVAKRWKAQQELEVERDARYRQQIGLQGGVRASLRLIGTGLEDEVIRFEEVEDRVRTVKKRRIDEGTGVVVDLEEGPSGTKTGGLGRKAKKKL